MNSGPAALDASDETGTAVLLFARGIKNDLVINFQEDGKPDNQWLSLGGGLTSAPSAAVSEHGLYVVARGGDGGIWLRAFELNVAYTQAEPITSYGWRGTDNALYLDTQGGSTVKAGGVLTSGATINAYWNGGYQRETYVRGANSALYRYLDDGTATPGKWEALGGKFT